MSFFFQKINVYLIFNAQVFGASYFLLGGHYFLFHDFAKMFNEILWNNIYKLSKYFSSKIRKSPSQDKISLLFVLKCHKFLSPAL